METTCKCEPSSYETEELTREEVVRVFGCQPEDLAEDMLLRDVSRLVEVEGMCHFHL